MSETDKVYTVCIININYILTVKHSIITAVKINDFTEKKKLLIILIDLTDIFNQKKTDVLLLYNKNVHMINLNNSKLLFKSLYNLSVSELEIIKMYLNIFL